MMGHGAPAEPTAQERADMIRRHLSGLIGRLGEEVAVREMRAQLACYLHGQKHASRYKTQAMEAKTFREIDELLKEWVEEVSLGSLCSQKSLWEGDGSQTKSSRMVNLYPIL